MMVDRLVGRAWRFSRRTFQQVRGPLDTAAFRRSMGALHESIAVAPGASTAVVVHLFHIKVWPQFLETLDRLDQVTYDLFVTLPSSERSFERVVMSARPDAHVCIVPNRGRDVLPFLQVARVLRDAGYTKVLKLHSKVSSPEWTQMMLRELIPPDGAGTGRLLSTLERPETGVIGPAAAFLPLSLSSEPEVQRMVELATRLELPVDAVEAVGGTDALGFFAGTMFWARLDCLDPVLDLGFRDFEPELGQWTGSTAHALERLFTVVPQVTGRVNYELEDATVHPLAGSCDTIPDWYLDIRTPEDALVLQQQYRVRPTRQQRS